jgi:hypothetical protein
VIAAERQPAFDDDQPDYFTPPSARAAAPRPARTVAPGGEPIGAEVKKFSIERSFGFVALGERLQALGLIATMH